MKEETKEPIKKEHPKKVGSWIIPKTKISFVRDDDGKLIPYHIDMELKQGHDWRLLPMFHKRVECILNSLDGDEWE